MEDDDETILIPEQDTSGLIQEYGLSLIGKVLNPQETGGGETHSVHASRLGPGRENNSKHPRKWPVPFQL